MLVDSTMDISEGFEEDSQATNSTYLALISQTQFLSGRLEDVHVPITWEDVLHATSLTLLAKVLATREFSSSILQSTFVVAANLSFVVKVSYVNGDFVGGMQRVTYPFS